MKPKLLVTELWGLGDLIIATPFLQSASARFSVTLVAKPYALDLSSRFWPEVEVRPFVAPWTSFRQKYRLWRWPWRQMRIVRQLQKERFDVGATARWDPRDHVLLWVTGAKERYGFSRLGSKAFLTHPRERPGVTAHRYEHWRALGTALGLEMPTQTNCFQLSKILPGPMLVHSGAGQPVRVWPLPKYKQLVERLRAKGVTVTVACDPDQRGWWLAAGEQFVVTPGSVTELMGLMDRASGFVGNDSGPAHLAAACGLRVFTFFGPQLPDWFAPLGNGSSTMSGYPCPYKPCSDYCRFPMPYCMVNVKLEEAWRAVEPVFFE